MPKVVTQRDAEVQSYLDERMFFKIECNGNGLPQKRPGAKRVNWPKTAVYSGCYDPRHTRDAITFLYRHVNDLVLILEPGGTIVMDPQLAEYPEVLKTFGFTRSLDSVRDQCIGKARHGSELIDAHTGIFETHGLCGVSNGFEWPIPRQIGSHIRGAEYIIRQVPRLTRAIYTFHYYWQVGERCTYGVNERKWRQFLGMK